jgi:V/A-type H+-transporting ATPase subunit I
MSIIKMKKLRLLAVSSQREALLRELMLLGCVEISEMAPDSEDPLLSGLKKAPAPRLQTLRQQQNELSAAVALLDKYAPAKGKLLAPLPDVELSRLLDESTLDGDLALAQQLIGLDDRIRRLTGEESRCRAEMEALAPWRELDLPLSCTGTETTAVQTATFPSSMDMDAAEAALRDAAELSQLFFVSADKSLKYVVLVCLRAQLEEAVAALRPMGYAQLTPGDTKGTAVEGIAAMSDELSRLTAEKVTCAEEIAAQGGRRDQLKLRFDTLSTMIARSEAEGMFLCTESVSCMTGWVPAEKLDTLGALLKNYDCAWETEDPTEDETPEVPVKLKNNRLTRCLNMVTEMYSLPSYSGVDPNPLMAPFFILFYGVMMADMGYGALMVIAALVVLKKKQPRGGMRNFSELLLYCGISTFIWGFITGGLFGDAPIQIARMLNPNTTWTGLWALFDPLSDTEMILIGSMALGFVQIVTGMAVSFVEKLKKHAYMDAIFEELTWWVVFAGLGCMVLLKNNIVLYIGIALVFAGPIITGTGFGKVTGIFGSLYNHVTGFFGDILSYTRLMALMLAGSVIAQVFNTLGTFTGSLVFFIPIFLLGHTLNFGLNLLGCYVHDMRLQCLEYFGKFYEDGGRPFKPLSVETKYYNTVNN